ncbi:Cu-Zn family superoxide dismutase [Oxalobacteraceae bacterium GrIS 2.11]
MKNHGTKNAGLIRLAAAFVLSAATVSALAVEVTMNEIDAAGKVTAVGTVSLMESPYGVIFTPNLTGLPPGMHGFHVHEKPNCSNTTVDGVVTVAGAAGGHWDPDHAAKHEGPYGQGHLGDLPGLYVAADGTATTPVLAPRIKDLSKLHALALMIHAGGDNHSDHPAKLGGGGARIACGVIN